MSETEFMYNELYKFCIQPGDEITIYVGKRASTTFIRGQ